MSQVVFDTTTTKGQALTGINANFTEVYGDLAGLGTASTHAATDFATSAQGAKADTALQSSDIGTTVLAPDGDGSALVGVTPLSLRGNNGISNFGYSFGISAWSPTNFDDNIASNSGVNGFNNEGFHGNGSALTGTATTLSDGDYSCGTGTITISGGRITAIV